MLPIYLSVALLLDALSFGGLTLVSTASSVLIALLDGDERRTTRLSLLGESFSPPAVEAGVPLLDDMVINGNGQRCSSINNSFMIDL